MRLIVADAAALAAWRLRVDIPPEKGQSAGGRIRNLRDCSGAVGLDLRLVAEREHLAAADASGLERVVPIDDPHIGHHLGVWRPIPLAWATAKNPPKLGTLADYKRQKRDYLFSDRYRDTWIPQLRELISARFEAQATQDIEEAGGIDDPVVVVKEPGSHAADTIMDLFPDSTLIFLLRDGRDVVDSWLDAYRDGSWATEEGAYGLDETGRPGLDPLAGERLAAPHRGRAGDLRKNRSRPACPDPLRADASGAHRGPQEDQRPARHRAGPEPARGDRQGE